MTNFLSRAGNSFKWRQPLGKTECPYAYRWVAPLGPLGSLRLHQWLASDDLRAAHNHPSDFLTIVLWGSYDDLQPLSREKTAIDRLGPGSVRFRPANHTHMVRINSETWTLLWFSPPKQDWGFFKPRSSGVGFRFLKAHKWFKGYGHHPCEQP